MSFPQNMTVKERILKVWGLPLDYPVIPIEGETRNVRVSGFIVPPEKYKTQRTYQIFFVNNRYIKSLMLNQAVQEGYSPLLEHGKFPMALVFIDIVGEEVDINVHPNKLEVRFVHPNEVFAAVRNTIKEPLKQFSYTPSLPQSADFDAQYISHLSKFATQPDKFHRDFHSIASDRDIGRNTVDRDITPLCGHSSCSSTQMERGLEIEEGNSSEEIQPGIKNAIKDERVPGEILQFLPLSFQPEERPAGDGRNMGIREIKPHPSGSSLPRFQALTQLHKTYIIGKVGEEIWVVDQHTAHERINYEKLAPTGIARTQQMLFPIVMELPAPLFAFLEDRREHFENLGFELEPFGGTSYLVKGVPLGFDRLAKKENILSIIEDVAGEDPYRNITAIRHRIRSTTACRASVKAGDPLTLEEMESLVQEMMDLDYSNFCPHGRPVVVKFSKEYLDRMFHRA